MLLTPEQLQKRPLVYGITPDDDDSRDRDDAIWITQDKDTGIITAYISITDLSAYIKKGDKLERRARKMHWTKYHLNGTKGNNDNMLGKEIAEEIATLLPNRIQPAQTIIAKFDKDFNFVSAELQLTRCLVREHVPPHELSKRLQPDGKYRLWGQLAYHINKNILKIRDIDNSEINTDDCITNTSKLVEVFMKFHNHTKAEIRHKLGIPGPYRNHLSPQDKHNYDLGVYDDSKKKVRTKKLLLDLDIVGKTKSPNATRAFYSPKPISHTVIKNKRYQHSSSPIRRYPDLVEQLMIHAYMTNTKYPYSDKEISDICHDCNVHAAADKKEKQIQINLSYRPLLEKCDPLPTIASEQAGILQACLTNPQIKSEELRNSLIKRLEKSRSGVTDIITDKLLLLLVHDKRLKKDEFWKPVQEKTIDYLEKNPERAISLLHLSCLAHRNWDDYKVRERYNNGLSGKQISVNIKGKSLSTKTVHLFSSTGEGNRANVREFWKSYMNNNLVPDIQTKMNIGNNKHGDIPAGTWNGRNAESMFRCIAGQLRWDYFYEYNGHDRADGKTTVSYYLWTGNEHPIMALSSVADDKTKAIRQATFELLTANYKKGIIPQELIQEAQTRKNNFIDNMNSTLSIIDSPVTNRILNEDRAPKEKSLIPA